ncbi:MAG: hypothetical protein KAQ83_01260 [Nanoarchaeota archaeon]|nr:hypothetical protein [Nanoarchaeota archaeon]
MKKLTYLLAFLLFIPSALAYTFDHLLDDLYSLVDSMMHSYYVIYFAILIIVFIVVRLAVKKALEKINFQKAGLLASAIGVFSAFAVHYFLKVTRLNKKIANLVSGNDYLSAILIAVLIYVLIIRKIKNAIVLLLIGIGLIVFNNLPFLHLKTTIFTITGIVFVLIALIKFVFKHGKEHLPGI